MNKKGFTLVEILVAMFLTGLVMAGLVGLWVSSTNFASSGKQELLLKNMFSVAEMKLYRDISEATYADTANAISCGSVSGKPATSFLVLYKNFSPDKDGTGGCLALPLTVSGYSVVAYCSVIVDTNVPAICRMERSCACGVLPAACTGGSACGMVMKYISSGPSASVAQNTVNVNFSAATTVGKENRPLQLDFNKTFSFMGVE
ncbi:MAG: type II secretion system GspH family protein [Elusimicrobia bacterium]|nr:type II secretion system GspH family protein [Elusimicrobiota bacterium]